MVSAAASTESVPAAYAAGFASLSHPLRWSGSDCPPGVGTASHFGTPEACVPSGAHTHPVAKVAREQTRFTSRPISSRVTARPLSSSRSYLLALSAVGDIGARLDSICKSDVPAPARRRCCGIKLGPRSFESLRRDFETIERVIQEPPAAEGHQVIELSRAATQSSC